ncbi:hypothetical protein WDU94_014533 [Cyamophila willieti]
MLSEWRVCIMVLVCTGSLQVFADCPSTCECKWKGGKETVICKEKNLTTIPEQIDAGTQVLDLSDNLFEETTRDLFQQLGLVNLQKIYLNKNKIKTLDRYTFRKLFNLVELDLSYNLLQFVPSHIFDSILELRELKLSGNSFQKITHEAFTNVPKLMRLEVSDCKITIVEVRAFSGLESSLEWLKIDRNKIVNIRPVTFTSLHSLKGIELYGNPWNCSCYLRPLREWLLRTNIPVGVPPICKYPPHMTGKSWERLNLEDFACSPNIRPITPDVTAEENENVTLSCRATGSPLPKIKWIFKEKVIANISSGLANTNKRQFIIRNVNSLSNLTILTATMSDSGIYTCKAKNGAGEVFTNISLNVIKVETAVAQPDPVYLVATLTTVVTIVLTACFVVLCIILLKARRKRKAANRRYLEDKCDSNHQQSKPLTLNKMERAPPPTSVAPSLPPARSEYSKVPLIETARKSDAKEDADIEEDIDKNNLCSRDASVYYNCNIGDVALGHHVLRKEVLPSGGGSLYTTATPGYPDLLENYSSSNSNK